MALIATVALLTGWNTPTPADAIHGYSTYYADGLMDRVISNRGLGYGDGIALNRAGDLGRVVWLEWGDGPIDGPLNVVDCAQAVHYETRERLGRVVEVSAELARERGFYKVGPAPVTVWLIEPPTTRWE